METAIPGSLQERPPKKSFKWEALTSLKNNNFSASLHASKIFNSVHMLAKEKVQEKHREKKEKILVQLRRLN